MAQYHKVNVKLSDLELNKLKSTVKNQTTLKRNMKMFDGGPHELLLTARQKIKLRNAFENNMSADIRFSKSQIFKIIQSGGLLGVLLSKISIGSIG